MLQILDGTDLGHHFCNQIVASSAVPRWNTQHRKWNMGCSVWCTDSDVNDPNYKFSHHLHTFTSFLSLAFPSTPTTFPSTFTCQQSILQSTLQPFTETLVQSEPWDVLSSSRGVLGSHAVYLAPQLLLWTVFLVFPQGAAQEQWACTVVHTA